MDIFADVLAANMLTAMFVYGVVLATREERTSLGTPSWFSLAIIAFPLGMLIIALLATEPLPPSLDALAAH